MPTALVISRPGARPSWAERLDQPRMTEVGALPDDLSAFDSVWIDAAGQQPLKVARTVAVSDPSLQAVVVAPPEDIGIHQRTLLFTPGIGEVWILAPDDVGAETLGRAREVTATRRQYRESQGELSRTVEDFSATRPRRTVVSDAYLAALLTVLTDPVISVDEEDSVVSWSDAAERCFGIPDAGALGRPVKDVLQPKDPAAFEEALERSHAGTAHLEVELAGVGGPLRMMVAITPVEAGGLDVRALVLRDVTREREAMIRLEREVELRSRFYAAMSHEIRTPINSIMGYNELMRSGAAAEDKRDLYLERSNMAAQHLLELVNDVLDLSKLEAGALEVQRESMQVDELLQDLATTLDPLAQERETPLEVHCDPEPPRIETDPRRLKQILMNLVTNALKFGQQRPVRLSCHHDDRFLRLEVADQGTGIAEDDQERIFEEFVQVGNSGEGTGLGLSISRKLAELLGGELLVESELGEGTTFRLILPLDPDPAEPPRTRG